jgi:hypothetical protein
LKAGQLVKQEVAYLDEHTNQITVKHCQGSVRENARLKGNHKMQYQNSDAVESGLFISSHEY